MLLSGNEEFTLDEKSTGLSMLDFWKFQFSNIYNLQDVLAEFIVAKALEKNESDNDMYWTLFDISYRGKRIEVKESSYYHSYNKEGCYSSQRTFGIGKANSNYGDGNTENRYERQNDVYVFCLNTGYTENESNPLNLNNWQFYVVPTFVINEKCGENKTISLGRIQSLGFDAKRYDEIKGAVDLIIDTMEQSK